MIIEAPAKVNLFLAVRGIRSDGYRELETIIQAVGLYDTLEVSPGKELSLTCSNPSVPVDGRNLVAKAAELLLHERGVRSGASIHIEKRIPVAGGMGGGSSDSAAALVALNELWGLGLGPEELIALAAGLGSDVPFFIDGPVALCRGRGEIVQAIDSSSSFWVVLVNPRAALSTPVVYAELGSRLTGGDHDLGPVLEGLEKGDIGMVVHGMYNELDGVACGLLPVLNGIKLSLMGAGCVGAMVSGSGPTVFGVAETEAQAIEVAEEVGRRYPGYLVEAVRALNG